jgi:predicted CXXCH cytochrome family protein
MRNRLKGRLLVGVGLCLLLAALSWLLIARPDTAQAVPPAQDGQPPNLGTEYVGTVFCRMCHTQEEAWHASGHAQIVRPASAETILGDLSDTAAVTITWPDGSERPVTPEDITYVLGGNAIQQYVSVIEREDGTPGYYVLPITWNIPQNDTQTGVWTPYHLEDWQEPARDWRVACAGCHTTGLDKANAGDAADFAFLDDWEKGAVELNVGCESCHGPGGEHRANKGTLVKSPDAQICGQCHAQGRDPSGDHAYPINYQPGLALDDSVFVLTPTDDTTAWWMTGHARAYNQYGEWLTSGHASSLDTLKTSDLADDSCVGCHAAPAGATLDETQFSITCVACHNPHPGEGETAVLDETYDRCVACHNSATAENQPLLVGGQLHHPVQEMFEGLRIVENIEGIPSGHFSTDGGPTCVDCHMPKTVQIGEFAREGSHTLNTVLCADDPCDIETDSCVSCHTDLTPQYMQRFIQGTQERISERLTAANESAANAPAWVKTALAFIGNDGSQGVHNYAYTDALLSAVEHELNLTQVNPATSPVSFQATEPETCATCHRDQFQRWQVSPHANASQTDTFLQEFAIQGRPNYCMSCHASGYDANTGAHDFEGVICTSCHLIESGAQHPPDPVAKADAPIDCGRCHSGAHAPTYDEWLVSDHKRAGIDCVDCHTPHDNGLILGDVNTTCGDCHAEALVDDIHMGEAMTCVDCHMSRQVNRNGSLVRTTGHTMSIDPSTCAECHGNTHLLSARGESVEDGGRVQELEEEVEEWKATAEQDRNSGIIGGALGAVIVVAVLLLMVRLRKLL